VTDFNEEDIRNKEEELRGDWRKLHNEDFHDSCSQDIIRLIK
jgi:hypothetical protein